jgi:hypothetical protein
VVGPCFARAISPKLWDSCRKGPSIVGGVAAGLALLGIAGWLLWRQRTNQYHEVAQDDVPELSAADTTYPHMKAGGDISELSSYGKPVELEQPPVELDATERFTGTEDRR